MTVAKRTTSEATKAEISEAACALSLSVFNDFERHIDPARPFDENLLSLLKAQIMATEGNRFLRRIKNAGFPQIKNFDTFEMNPEKLPQVNFDLLNSLKNCKWIDECLDVAFLGPSGHGKTHLATALGYEACRLGYSVIFKRAYELVAEMAEAQSEKRLLAYKKKLAGCRLLVIDEVDYLNYDANNSSLLFQIVNDRHEKASTIFTSNKAFGDWPSFMGDETLARAIIDRIIYHSNAFYMNGPSSYRLDHAQSRIAAAGSARGSAGASAKENE